MTTLVLSPRHRADDQLLWRAATSRGWQVERANRIGSLQPIDDEVVIYAEAFLAPLIAKALQRSLIEPTENWLPQLPKIYRQREIRAANLSAARTFREPHFVKPPNDKSFPAKVYQSGELLPSEYDGEMTVLLAEPVRFLNEYRCFVLNGQVRAISPYVIDGELAEQVDYAAPQPEMAAAKDFANLVASDARTNLPIAVALDVGIIDGRGWAVVEANGAWGSGIYGCDPDAVLDVLRAATVAEKAVA